MSLIPLVIKSPESPQPTKYIWQNLTTMETFVKSISTYASAKLMRKIVRTIWNLLRFILS